jgi:hypothetical protein
LAGETTVHNMINLSATYLQIFPHKLDTDICSI